MKIPVLINLDEETFKIYDKIPKQKRSMIIRKLILENLNSEKIEKNSKEEIKNILNDGDYVKETEKTRKTMNKILYGGAYSHRNEIITLQKMAIAGAPKKEIKVMRLFYAKIRRRTKELVENVLKDNKEGLRLESLKSKNYLYRKVFVPQDFRNKTEFMIHDKPRHGY